MPLQRFVLSEDVVPSPYPITFDKRILDPAPLARELINLWAAALQTGSDASDICLRLAKAQSNGNSYQMCITATKTVSGGVKVGLASLGITAGGDLKATTGSTVTIRFRAHDFAKPTPPRPRPCKRADPREDCRLQHLVVPGWSALGRRPRSIAASELNRMESAVLGRFARRSPMSAPAPPIVRGLPNGSFDYTRAGTPYRGLQHALPCRLCQVRQIAK